MTDNRRWGLVLLLLAPIACIACIAIGSGGKGVTISSESAIIVWDAKAHVERFTRLANFATDAKDLGFLVPTPTPPKLVEASRTAFSDLTEIVENHLRKPEEPAVGATAAKAADPVLSVTFVGGYEATVLSLANHGAVDGWLKSHGFPKGDAASEWLALYEKKHWVITAFRVIAKDGAAGLNPVQMTFHADVPFYPYREPTGGTDESRGRSLRVFFLADAPVEAVMGGKPWVAKSEMSDKLNMDEIVGLQPSMPGVPLTNSPWLTSFIDTSSPRIGTDDVFFRQAPRTSTPLIVVLIVLANVVYFGLRYRRRFQRGFTMQRYGSTR